MWCAVSALRIPTPKWAKTSGCSIHSLELVDHALNDTEALLPEFGPGGVEPEGLEQLGVVLGAAGFEHVEVFRHEAWVRIPVEPVERVHEAVAEGVGVNVEGRMD